MNRIVLSSLALLFFAACSPPPPSSPDSGSDGISAPLTPVRTVGLGDVETAMTFEARLDPESKGEHIRNEEMISMRKDLAKVDLTLFRPFPEHLWLTFGIAKDVTDFQENPVLVRAGIYIDEVVVRSFSYVLTTAEERGLHVEKLDVLAGLDAIPKTMLVHAEAKLIVLEKGKPVPEDLDTVEARPDITATLYSNPVRIDFNF